MFNLKARAIKAEILLMIQEKLAESVKKQGECIEKAKFELLKVQEKPCVPEEVFIKRRKETSDWFYEQGRRYCYEEKLLRDLISKVKEIK